MGCGIVIESLESRRLLAGVTLITHGFNGSAGGWVTTMGSAIARFGGEPAQQPRYLMTVTDPGHDGGPLSVASTRIGAAPANWTSTDIVVLLDWSDISGSLFGGYSRPSAHTGAAVAEKLLGGFSIPDLAAPLAELPLHLVGHSRGASVISEIARGLGQRGAWVDQLTFLDPHPVDGVREPFLAPNLGDAAMRVFENVQFADNYWRTDGNGSFDFTGEPVNGAYNLQLTESVLTGTGTDFEHSDTHLWYHGTIGRASGDPPFQDSDGDANIGANWYAPPHPARDASGYVYSRIGAGARPAAGLKSSGAFRDALALTSSGAAVWDNIRIDGFTSDVALTQGSPLFLTASFEDRSAGGVRDSTITIGFDRDDDPYNGVFNTLSTVTTSSLASDVINIDLPTNSLAGTFNVYAKISNGVHTRYDYANGRAIVSVAGHNTWLGPATGEWTTGANWSGGVPDAGDRVAIVDADVSLRATTTIAGLRIGGAGSLDVHENALVIDYAEMGPLETWDGSGYTGASGLIASGKLISSAAGAATTLAAAEAADVLALEASQTAIWNGQAVDGTSVLVRFTYAGDATLDGAINIDDYGRIDAHVARSGSVWGWFNGDFNYDGLINIDDYGIIDSNLSGQT